MVHLYGKPLEEIKGRKKIKMYECKYNALVRIF